jgi:signal transduction histidine kinase
MRPLEDGALLMVKPDTPSKTVLEDLVLRKIDGYLSSMMLLIPKLGDADLSDHDLDRLQMRLERDAMRIHRTLRHAERLLEPRKSSAALRLENQDMVALCRKAMQSATVPNGGSGQHDVKLTLRTPKKLEAVCDRSVMMIAICNLLANAIRAKGATEVTVTLSRVNGRVLIAVQGDGAAVDPEELARLYEGWHEPFSSVRFLEQAVSGVHTGLGLPVARQAIAMHGGILVLDSDAEGHSVFRLVFPADLDSNMKLIGAGHLEMTEIAPEHYEMSVLD